MTETVERVALFVATVCIIAVAVVVLVALVATVTGHLETGTTVTITPATDCARP